MKEKRHDAPRSSRKTKPREKEKIYKIGRETRVGTHLKVHCNTI